MRMQAVIKPCLLSNGMLEHICKRRGHIDRLRGDLGRGDRFTMSYMVSS